MTPSGLGCLRPLPPSPTTPHNNRISDLEALIYRLEGIFEDKGQYQQLLTLRDVNAQKLLDLFQGLLDAPGLDPSFRRSLIVATQRLSNRCGLYPACYELQDVQYTGDPVAAGSFADVYKGSYGDKVVSIKVIRVYQTSRVEYFLKRCAKEAVLWGQLSHPNVLAIYGLYRLQSKICLVSPWMDHGDLNDYLHKEPNVDRRLLASDVAQGLLYLHSNSVVHGDLKAANILVSGSGRAHLADFGLSSVSDVNILAWTSNSSAASKGGSVRWQAPELFDFNCDEPIANSDASDVYALACVWYEARIFAGVIPFSHIPLDVAVIFQVKNGATPMRPPESSDSWGFWGLTESIWDFMTRCWNADPTERPNVQEAVVALIPHLGPDTRPDDRADTVPPTKFRKEIGTRFEMISVGTLEQLVGIPPSSALPRCGSQVSFELDSPLDDLVVRQLAKIMPDAIAEAIVQTNQALQKASELQGLARANAISHVVSMETNSTSSFLFVKHETSKSRLAQSWAIAKEHIAAKLLSVDLTQDTPSFRNGVFSKSYYTIATCFPYTRDPVYEMDGPTRMIQMFSTPLAALVQNASYSSRTTHKLQIVNTEDSSLACELPLPLQILGMKVNNKIIVIVSESAIYVYGLSNSMLLLVIGLSSKPELVALSPSVEDSYLAYQTPLLSSSQGEAQQGMVSLLSVWSCTIVNEIQAHDAPVSYLTFNSSGKLLATASEMNATIRVWSVPSAELLHEFRYGAHQSQIYCMNFNFASTLLVIASARGMAHLFKLESANKTTRRTAQTSTLPNITASGEAATLEPPVHGTVNCFAYLFLPTGGARYRVVCDSAYVMATSMDGVHHVYRIDQENGKECFHCG